MRTFQLFPVVGLIMKNVVCMFAIVVASGMSTLVAQEEAPWKASARAIAKFSSRAGFNFEEQRVPSYTLPNPLIGKDGARVESGQQWNGSRRGAVLELFREHVYGRRPTTEYELEFEQIAETKDALGGKATGQ